MTKAKLTLQDLDELQLYIDNLRSDVERGKKEMPSLLWELAMTHVIERMRRSQ